jgi:conjugal transfer ATP-binding protein TraC
MFLSWWSGKLLPTAFSFSYDPSMKAPDHTPEAIAAVLNEKAEVARRYLDRCGVAVLEPEYADNFILELFYKLINKHTSQHLRLPDGVFDMLGMVHGVYDEEALKALDTAAAESAGKKKRKWFSRKEASPLSRLEAGATTIPDLIAPPDIDTHHPDYLLIDGVCHAYLYISGYGYSTVVGKGWLTPLIEAGEGVSLSFYLVKQPREKTVNAIGQTTMINRSRMRDVGDTRQDFEELGDAIGAGLYLKEGMNREGQDFYYMHTLIEVIADDPDTLEQRVTAVETLCVASDMLAKRCEYKHEAAFLSFLPLLISDPDIERKSRRNALTSGVAASFPFASFELSDQKGIFLGLNLYNRSPVFIDLYDDYKYTNGNFAAFGNSGAGKSTLLQSIGKRLREQQRKVIYIVPEKGHEYRPLCEAVGGQFIKLGPSSPDCIGLMDIRRLKASPYAAQNGGTQRRESLLAEKVSWLSVWYSLQKRNLSEEDMNYIDASLIECYGRRGITFDNASLFEEDGVTIKEMPVIQEWYDILREKQETKHLSVILTRYVSGSAASMGGHTNVDTENPYIVIDLTDIPDDLQLATVYAATGFATDITVQNGDVGTALLSDELWKLLGANSNPLAADYTMRMVKLIRSQGGVAGVTSQGMADMMALDGGKYGKGILDSCRIKFIMQMEDQEARLVQNILNLTEEETKMITRFRRGEGLLCIGHNHVPIAVHVSPREYEAITTSPTDLRARQQARVE